MSNWYEVAILAESMQQQVQAALHDYGPIPKDEKARALIGQATYAMGQLHDHATKKIAEMNAPKGITKPAIMPKVALAQTYDDLPKLFMMFASVAGVDTDVFTQSSRAEVLSDARAAIAWMMYYGVAYRVQPSWPELARTVRSNNHSTLISASYRSQDSSHLISKMFDVCEEHAIATRKRPAWAKEAA
jgi:hypothetical protein